VVINPDLDIGRTFLAANPPPGRVVLCAVTGAHCYGFPSPDSDLDLKGIHLAPTRQLLGLRPTTPLHDRTAYLGPVECDLTTNEAGQALSLLLNGNGNMLERILSPLQLVGPGPEAGDEVSELQELARGAVSARFARHYGGFFRGCQREHERQPTVKSLLYSYRAACTGIHLLATGRLETDLTVLAPELGYAEVLDLVARKRAGTEHGGLPEAVDHHHRAHWPGLAERLAVAEATTSLPPIAANGKALEAWLVARRLADLNG
jgi:uncharacterized protein